MADYRETGKLALKCYITKEQNINILEKYVYQAILGCYKNMQDGSTKFIEKYNLVLYQVIGDILNKKKLNDIALSLKNYQIEWDHDSYDELKIHLEEQDNFAENPIEIEEGVETCKKCKSTRVYSYSVQVRSADEGFTTFCSCMGCGSKWSHTG